MTEEQINIAIAEACGNASMSISCQRCDGDGWCGGEGDAYACRKCATTGTVDPYYIGPDYLNDLNAMHEAEKVLTIQLWAAYSEFVNDAVKPEAAQFNEGEYWKWSNTWKRNHMCATAAQRAEAFLRTIGKWKEAP